VSAQKINMSCFCLAEQWLKLITMHSSWLVEFSNVGLGASR